MKFSIKYFILVLSMVYSSMANCQYGTVSTTSSCPDEGTGSATVSLYMDLFESDWHNPPFSAEVENLDTGEEWEGVIGTQQGNLLSGTFDNLTDGDYEVTINVSPRCFLTLEFSIETSPVLTLDKIESQITNACSSTSTDGKIEISINDLNGPYTITWYRLQNIRLGSVPMLYFLLKKGVIYTSNNGTEDLVNIGEGNYLVQISDGKCTELAISFHVSGELYIESQEDIFICSENTGEITPTIIGGNLPLSYLWSNGQTGSTAVNLGSGTFSVTVTDNTQCTAKRTFTVKKSNIKFDLEKKNKVCDDGILSYVLVKNLRDGKSPYSFLWNNGMTGDKIVNLSAGSYAVTVTDDAGCTKQANAQIINQNSGIHPPTIKNAQECVCDGSIQVKFYGTTFPSGTWYSGSEIYRAYKSGDQSIYNLCPGLYRFYDDNFNCPIDEVFYIEEDPCVTQIQLVDLKHPCGCTSGSQCDGSISVNITNPPSGDFTYTWYKNDVFFVKAQNINNLCPGTYKLVYTHSGLNQPLVKEYVLEDVDCSPDIANLVYLNGIQNAIDCYNSDGFIDLGSTGNYNFTYKWNTQATTQDITGLSEGNYRVTVSLGLCAQHVMDFYICTCSTCFDEYPNPIPGSCGYITVKEAIIHATSSTVNDGSIVIVPSDKERKIVYKWSGPNEFIDSKRDIFNLYPGLYILTINDGCNYLQEKYYVKDNLLCESNPIKIDADITCLKEYRDDGTGNDKNGKINLQITGGTPPYTYKWNTGAKTQNINVFKEGYYRVTVTDKNGCNAIKDIFMELVKYGYTWSRPIIILEYPTNTFRLCDDSGANTDGAYITYRIMGGVTKKKIRWHDGFEQEVFMVLTDPETGLKWVQISRYFPYLNVNEPFEYGIRITEPCERGTTIGDFTSYGTLACNKGLDENNNPIPCFFDITTNDLRDCYDPRCGDGFDPFDTKCKEATFKNHSDNDAYDIHFFPSGWRTTILPYYGSRKIKYDIPHPGIFFAVAIDQKNRGCRQTYKIDYLDICDTPDDQVEEVSPNGEDCPFGSTGVVEVTDRDNPIVTLNADLNGVSDDGEEAKVIIKNKEGGNVLYSYDTEVTNGTNIIEFEKSVLGDVAGALTVTFWVEIIFPNLSTCPKPIGFPSLVSGEECPAGIIVTYNRDFGDGSLSVYSLIDVADCELRLPGQILTVDLNKGENDIDFNIPNLAPGEYTITLIVPGCEDHLKAKLKILGTPCINTFSAVQDKPNKKITFTINSPAYIEKCKWKFYRQGSLKKEISFPIDIGNNQYTYDIASLPLGQYTVELHFGDLDCARLSKDFNIDPECEIQYSNRTHGFSTDGLTFKVDYKKPTALQVTGIVTIENALREKVHESIYNLPVSVNTGDYQIKNLNLPKGSYRIEWKHPEGINCPKWTYDFSISGFKDDDPISFKGCENNFIDLVYDSLTKDYTFFWGSEIDNRSFIMGHNFKKLDSKEDVSNYSILDLDHKNMKNVRIDSDKNHILTKVEENGSINIAKYNNTSNTQWSNEINNKVFKGQIGGLSSGHSILVYDSIVKKYQKIDISENGQKIEKTLSIPDMSFTKMMILPDQVLGVRYSSSNTQLFVFSLNGDSTTLMLDKNLSIKNAKPLPNGHIMIAGDYKGIISMNGKTFDSDGFTNAFFFEIDYLGNLYDAFTKQNHRDEIIQNFDTDGKNNLAYYGQFVERDYFSDNPLENFSDTCTFIHLIELKGCTATETSFTLDSENCSLNWTHSPSDSFELSLQKLIEGNWVSLPNTTSPFTPDGNESYRLLSSKQGCNDAISEVINVTCQEVEPCTEEGTNTYTLNIVQDCNMESNGVLVPKLRLEVPTFIGSSYTTDWEVALEGEIIGYGNNGIIYTNGIGSYKATINYGICSYTRTFNYSYQPNVCDPACQIVPPTLTYDDIACTITWDGIQSDSITIFFQYFANGAWTTIPNALAPFTPTNNGAYRFLSIKLGCIDHHSIILNVNCITEPCTEDPIDITYSETENKFLYFYKTDGSGQLVKSEWISPVTYMMVDSFITWSCENIIIKDIVVDDQLNVYVIGSDTNLINKTRIIKYNWSTKQILWSQWEETFIYQSLVPYAVNNILSLAIAGFNTNENRWYIKGYNKLTGINTYQSMQPVKTVTGKLGWGFDWIRVFQENVYSFVAVHPTYQDLHYDSPTTKWIAPLPPVLFVREIVKLRNENIVIGGDFTGTFTLNDVVYESYPYRSIFLIEFDEFGIIINVKIFRINKHRVLKTFTTDGYYKFAYTGYTTENLNIGENVLLDLELLANHPDACAVVDGGSLSETQLRNAIQVHPESVVKFYPNPFTKGINLDIDSPQRDVVSIVVINSIGSVMFTTKVDVEAGQNSKYLSEFEQLPSGVYTVKLKSDLMDHTTRVIRIE